MSQICEHIAFRCYGSNYHKKRADVLNPHGAIHVATSGFRNAMCLFPGDQLQVQGLQHLNFRVPGDCIWHVAKTWNTAIISPLTLLHQLSGPKHAGAQAESEPSSLGHSPSPAGKGKWGDLYKFGWHRNRNHYNKLVLDGALPTPSGIEWLVPVVCKGCKKECGLPTKGLFE